MDAAAAQGVDWFVMRVVVDPRIPDGLADVTQRWTFADLLQAHFTLDALDRIEAFRRQHPSR